MALTLVSCGDPWEDHIAEGESGVNQSLLERLAGESDVSIFLGLLKEADLSAVLDGRNAYTIFAPTNTSIEALAPTLRNDKDALTRFVQNHIAVSTHRLNTSADTIQLTMLNGKILDLVASRIAGVTFHKANLGGADGLYHVLAGPLLPQQNLWEYITGHQDYAQNQFIAALNAYSLYTDGEEEDPQDSLLNNEFLQNLGDVRVEKDRYTYFVLANEVFEQGTNAFLPYVNYHNHADSSAQISRYHVVKDLVFAQAYDKESLPEELVSITGVTFPVDKNAITQTIQLSNGYVHILGSSTLPLTNKLIDLVVEGEYYSGFLASVAGSIGNSTFIRVRKDPDGVLFRDIMIQNHGLSGLRIQYDLPFLYSTIYDVYWRAVNDIQSNVFQQRLLMMGLPTVDEQGATVYPTLHDFPYTNVPLRNYDEVYLGSFELAEFRKVIAWLQAAAVTTNGNNTLVLDYLRFVPKVK